MCFALKTDEIKEQRESKRLKNQGRALGFKSLNDIFDIVA